MERKLLGTWTPSLLPGNLILGFVETLARCCTQEATAPHVRLWAEAGCPHLASHESLHHPPWQAGSMLFPVTNFTEKKSGPREGRSPS